MKTAKILKLRDEAACAALGARYEKAFAFLRRKDLKTLPAGRYEIEGDRVFATVSDNILKAAGEVQRPEFHRRYADVQAPLTGEEIYGLPALPEAVEKGAFDAERDIAFFDASCPLQTVYPGECIVFEPGVAHAPCLSELAGVPLRKVVIKVAY